MIKNRTAQLVFQTAYCAIGFMAILASVGLYECAVREDFYVFFTNLSNYLCFGIMLAELIQTIKKKQDGYVSVCPCLKFCANLAIMLTFFVFNILLTGEVDTKYLFSMDCICLHILLPIMFVVDWFLFYEHGKALAFYPLTTVIIPICYMAFVFVRASIVTACNFKVLYLYPYFFLNIDKVGVIGVVKWIAVLAFCFVALAYVMLFADRLIGKKKKQSQE